MKMVKEGQYYYIRGQYNKQKYHLSTKQKGYAFAKIVYDRFCDALFSVKIPKSVQRAIDEIQGVVDNRVVYDKAYIEYMNYTREKNSVSNIRVKSRVLGVLGKYVEYVGDIKQDVIDSLIELWAGCNGGTKNVYFSYVKAFLNWSIKKGYYEHNNYVVISFPNYKTKRRNIIISPDDFQILLDSVHKADFKMYLQVLWATGMRVNEPCGLRVRDICTVENRGRTVVYLKVFQQKTNRLKQCILPSDIASRLIDFVDGRGDDDFLFAGGCKDNQYYSKKFSRLIKAIDWQGKKYTLSAFRHTYATRLLDLTGDLELVKNQLGHANIKTTIGYTHRNVFEYAKVIERLAG
jgi:integrase